MENDNKKKNKKNKQAKNAEPSSAAPTVASVSANQMPNGFDQNQQTNAFQAEHKPQPSVALDRHGVTASDAKDGAQSVVLFGGYEDGEDHDEWFLYTGRVFMRWHMDLWLVTCLSLLMCILLLLVNFIQNIYFHAQSWLPARSIVMDCLAARKDVDSSGEIVLLPLCPITASGTSR